MSASIEARATRRVKQLGISPEQQEETLKKLKAEMQKRDDQDSSRALAPLTQTEDSVFFDTSDLSFDQCVEKLSSLVKKQKNSNPVLFFFFPYANACEQP